ncbi:MAG: Rab family GTPase [Candidatus Thorarchaeota archaeon]
MVFRLKIIILGEPGVGKTSLVKKFVSGQFSKDYRASIGTNIFIKKLNLNKDKSVVVYIWDIAGQERWINMRRLYYRGAHGVLIVGDLTRRNTFDQLQKFWNPDLLSHCTNIPKILIANKNDLNYEVHESEIKEIGKVLEVKKTLFTSAKNGENVEKSFELISNYALKDYG